MKKLFRLCLLLPCLVLAIKVYGQEYKFAAGLEGGPNLVTLYGNQALRTDRLPYFRAYRGFSFQYNLNSKLSLRSGLAYEKKGHKREFFPLNYYDDPVDFGVENTAYINHDYYTLPVLLRYTRTGTKVNFFANGGVFIGYARNLVTVMKQTSGPDLEFDNSSTIMPLDFGCTAGIGLAAPISPELEFSLELRNNLGLTNLSKGPVINNGTIKTNSLNLLLGLNWRFGPVKSSGL